MPPQSRGQPSSPGGVPPGFQSKSTPNLPTLPPLNTDASPAATLRPEYMLTTHDDHDDHDHDHDHNHHHDHHHDSASPDSATDQDDEDEHVPNLPSRPIYHHHSRSHTHLGPSAFAPPFYNRPPTPLPPSPSLTSLLRPTFSSQNSRPTTPDPSSDEAASHPRADATGTHTPNSAAASTLTSTFRSAKPIPRASPKVPTYEYYGFTLYLMSSLAFIVYVLWAYLPSPFLHQLGIYYYPNRWWALAIPAWTVMWIVYIYVALASYNVGYLTLPLHRVETLVDEAANVAVVDAMGHLIRTDRPSWQHDTKPSHAKKGSVGKKPVKHKSGGHSRQSSVGGVPLPPDLNWSTLWNEGTDAVMDIPIGGVCEILYGDHGDDVEDAE